MGVLRTIAIIIIVYYVFKAVSRIVLPIFMKNMMHNMERKYSAQQGTTHDNFSGKVGETVITKKPIQKEGNKDVGDYVDFEEVND